MRRGITKGGANGIALSIKCRECGQFKLSSEFHKNSGNICGFNHACKECIAPLAQIKDLKRLYGITLCMYYDMMAMQGNCCGICGSKKPDKSGKKTMFCVDHDHRTGAIRGLLCSECNRAIGLLCDNKEILARAIEYLKAKGDK